MTDTPNTETKTINPLVYIALMIVAFFVISKGGNAYADYNMMKKALAKIEFLEQNNAPQFEVCSAISWALDVAKQTQNQEKYDALMAKQSNCI